MTKRIPKWREWWLVWTSAGNEYICDYSEDGAVHVIERAALTEAEACQSCAELRGQIDRLNQQIDEMLKPFDPSEPPLSEGPL